jgi:hypothetical protein
MNYLLGILVFFSGLGFADQCAWNEKGTAQKARAFLAYYPGPISPYIPRDKVKIVEDVSEADFLDAYAKKYPNDPKG